MDTKLRFSAEVVEVRPLAPLVMGVGLVVNGNDFHWVGGQYVVIGDPTSQSFLPYSIASAESKELPTFFELAVSKRTPTFLTQAVRGSQLWTSEPQGNFVRRPGSGPTLLVAVGTGVAPMRAMIQDELARKRPASDPMVLLYGCRRADEILFRSEFEQLARLERKFSFMPTLSEPDSTWYGAKGRVQSHLSKVVLEHQPSLVYICGTPEMAASTTRELLALGLDEAAIRSQAYA